MNEDTTVFDMRKRPVIRPSAKPPTLPSDNWQVLYDVICSSKKGMLALIDRPTAVITMGLFMAAILSVSATLSGVMANFSIYISMTMMVAASTCAIGIITLATIHFWASMFGWRGEITGLFRATSGACVPLICLLPISMLGVSPKIILACVVWFVWRFTIAISLAYKIDIIQAVVLLIIPFASFFFFGFLFAAGEFSLLFQML